MHTIFDHFAAHFFQPEILSGSYILNLESLLTASKIAVLGQWKCQETIGCLSRYFDLDQFIFVRIHDTDNQVSRPECIEVVSMNKNGHRPNFFCSVTLPYRCNSYVAQVSQKWKLSFCDTWPTQELQLLGSVAEQNFLFCDSFCSQTIPLHEIQFRHLNSQYFD